MAAGYQGPLYLEVVPLSFAVRVKEDLTLNQLRLSVGRPWLSDEQIRAAHAAEPILFRHAEPVPVDDLVLSDGLFLGLDLHGDEQGRVGHSTRDSAPLLDLTTGHETDPGPFWDAVYLKRATGWSSPPPLLSVDVARGSQHPALSGGGDDRLRPDQRGAAGRTTPGSSTLASGTTPAGASGARGRPSRSGRTMCPSW